MVRALAVIIVLLGAVAGVSAQPLRGTVEQHSFVGPITGRTVLFNIYLPEGYAMSTQRYPVVYHLHGIGGNQPGSVLRAQCAAQRAARGKLTRARSTI